MKAQVDENLPPVLARILNPLANLDGDEVVHVRDFVGAGTKDLDLFAAAAAKGIRIHITKDHHRNPLERDEIARAGFVVFVLSKSWNSFNVAEHAVQLLRWWPHIVGQAARIQGGAIFRVPWKPAKFEVVPISNKRTKRP